MKVVIMAGGKGTRLWPLSREDYPKQFIKILDGRSLVQRAVDLYSRLGDVYIVTSRSLYPLFSYEVKGVKQENIIQEPAPRGTAPAIAYALSRLEDDDIMFAPSDHLLDESFVEVARKVRPDDGEIVLFGHRPEYPATGYGYIWLGDEQRDGKIKVRGFYEKPGEREAEEFLRSGRHLWNMGIFYMKRSTGVEAIRRHLPDVYRAVFEQGSSGYEELPEISFDRGVVEKHDRLSAVVFDGLWKDLGSWNSFYEAMRKDERGNAVHGNAVAVESEGSLAISDDRLTVLYGVKDLAVISTRDAVLVIPRELSERTKDVVRALSDRKEVKRSIVMYRPWGYYVILDEGERYKVKRLFVAPGKSLSYQMHYHRAEHWVVVRGTARITFDGQEVILTENQSFYVPMGRKHRIENPGRIPLEIIEIQTGEYLEEDDIVRFEG
ncbi:MAG: mannose-1-phosphate guanylyltransferase/mannose-6-phosphate isomerase [Nitrososphaeria archaeon]